jgi:hypothetical protein
VILTQYRLGSLGEKRERADHFALYVVAGSQEAKCELKYVIYSFQKLAQTVGNENLLICIVSDEKCVIT